MRSPKTAPPLGLLSSGSGARQAKLLDLGEGKADATSYVLVETYALVQSRLGMEALRSFDEDVLPVVAIHWVGETKHKAGISAVLAANRKKLSLLDCLGFATIRATGTRRALAVDAHFEEQGFQVLPKVG